MAGRTDYTGVKVRDKHRRKLSRRRKREAAEIAARTPTQRGGTADPAHFDLLDGMAKGYRSLPFEITEFQPPDAEIPDNEPLGTPLAELPLPAPEEFFPTAAQDESDEVPTPELDLQHAAEDAAGTGNIKRALRLYRTILKRDSEDLNAQYRLAVLLEQAGDREEALELLDRCVSRDPSNVAVRVNRGAILASVARYAEAESDLRKALGIDPANSDGYFNLGLVEVRRGRWSDAVAPLRWAIELDASNAAAHFYLGEALNHVDDIHGALQAYQRATELRPQNPAAFYGLGIVLDRLGRPEEATQMYRRSREMAAR